MTAISLLQNHIQQQQQHRRQRKLVVEVIEARNLIPKDGQGSSSAYVVATFEGQRKRTTTKYKDLNPVWNEQIEFVVTDAERMEAEELEVEVCNDKKMCSGSARKSHFLGRVKLCGSQIPRRGEEGLVYYSLEKKSVFSWIRGQIGLRIYYYDEEGGGEDTDGGGGGAEVPSGAAAEGDKSFGFPFPGFIQTEHPQPVVAIQQPPPGAMSMNMMPPPQQQPREVQQAPEDQHQHQHNHHQVHQVHHYPAEMQYPPEERKMEIPPPRMARRTNGDYSPRVIRRQKLAAEAEKPPPYGLVEPMEYLFIRIVKARGLTLNESPYVKIRTSNHSLRSKPAVYARGQPPDCPEWNQVFALAHSKIDGGAGAATLEISVWDERSEQFLGGVCFDLSDVPVRDPPDSPLAPQWYRLEGSADDQQQNRVSGDLQLSVWIGTQADEAFPESWSSDAPYVAYTRSKVYQSPKMWYCRVSVIEAQDLQIAANLPPLTTPDLRIRAQLGFQSVRTRRGTMSSSTTSFFWNEDLVFVAGEPLEDSLILLVEDRTCKEPMHLGHLIIPVASIDQRIDETPVPAKWFPIEGGSGGNEAGGEPHYAGRIHLRMCLEGGYHVLDEAAQASSDFRPTAKQLWNPPVGILELGILGARGLLPMKSKGPGKGSTDAYCVAKYGTKWVRTRTITDSFDPRWNEQYTWQVYDPCTVLTLAVFDNWRMFAAETEERPDCRIGKIRIRVSTLESNKVYTNSYPLLVLLRSGLKKMGEIEIAVRFVCPSLLPDVCSIYTHPMLPSMHYVRPFGIAQQEALRIAAAKMVAAWLARSEPPLGPEVVRFMLDADSHNWSMRKSKANWFRIVALLAWVVGLVKWLDDIRRWRNPVTTVLVHILYLVLVWYPDLIVPTGFLYVVLIGIWYYRFKPKIPAGMDIRLSQAETVDPDELDEEFDPIPSTKPPEIIRVRYDRLRMIAARVQTVLGDFAAQGERIQALVSWRDPRATKLFIGVCILITIVLYSVPPKMVAVALGFYFLRHPMFRDSTPPASLNFFRRLPSLTDRLI
uniref:C2 domain-containing protein n=1 Tax=Kalanchoe fedtschenkoi TaxID=63787 RepID=A0A7N0VLH9_KALFE